VAVDRRPTLVALRALGLGDLLTAVPALRALADAFPDHRRVLLAPTWLRPLVALLDGAVDAVADTEGRGAPPRALPAVARGADIAVNLHGRGPQSTELLRAAGPRRLIAFGDQRNAFGDQRNAFGDQRNAFGDRRNAFGEAVAWRGGEHEVARWCRLLEAHGIPADPSRLDLRPPAGPAPAPGATLVHPGAAAPARRWPPERWAAVALALGGEVVVTAGPGEEALACAVAEASGAGLFAGDLGALARLVAGAGRVVCADTGVAHLATALGTPSVVLFGPTDPAEWGPPRDRPQHRVLWAGRRGDANGARPDPGLLAIEPDAVLTALVSAGDATASRTSHQRRQRACASSA
jgi:ADP-heptose:LPS heptosyltransferase